MKRILVTLFWIFTVAAVGSAQTVFYFPHVVNGLLGNGIWKTTILLTNPGTATASGTISFTADNADLTKSGSPNIVTLTDETGVSAKSSVFPFSIAAGQTKQYVTSGSPADAYVGGFATVGTTAGAVSGTAIFSEFNAANGAYIGEAGVPAVPAVSKQAVLVDTLSGYAIGVAYANPSASAASLTLTLLDAQAKTVVSTTQTFGSGNHTAGILGFNLLPTATQPMVGTLQLQSSVPIAALALRFDPTFTIFTTLPPVTLSSLINPAVEWLEQRAWLNPVTSFARLLAGLQFRIG